MLDSVALSEIIAIQLLRFGAGQAESTIRTWNCAPWIRDHIDGKVRIAMTLPSATINKVLDACHAIGHLQAAMNQFGLSETILEGLSRFLPKQIRDGVRDLVEHYEEKRFFRYGPHSESAQGFMKRSIKYLRHHGSAGRMGDPKFTLMGTLLGCGPIERAIRTVINIRLKSNDMFWLTEQVKSILQLWCPHMSRRLDARLVEKRIEQSRIRKLDWSLASRQNIRSIPSIHPPNQRKHKLPCAQFANPISGSE